MTAAPDDQGPGIMLTDDRGIRHDVTRTARRYVAIRLKAVREHRAWLETSDDAHRLKRDDYLFRAAEIVTTIADLLGHTASKRFVVEAERTFGPVAFWP